MKKLLIIAIILLITGVGSYLLLFHNYHPTLDETTPPNQNLTNPEENHQVTTINIKVNQKSLPVKLESNPATDALIAKLKQENITVHAHEYGNFEKVGDLGFNLPTSDTHITTQVGDVMLYQGNQITIFYGSNSWSYTKLGEVTDEAKHQLRDILGNGDVTLVLTLNHDCI